MSEFILDDKLSQESVYFIKHYCQYLYKIFYENLTNITCEQIIIPIYKNTDNDYDYRVNYIEQAKFYNIFYSDELKNFDIIDLKVDTIIKNIFDNLSELKKIKFYIDTEIHKYIDMIMNYCSNLKTPMDKILFLYIIENLFDKINEKIIDKIIADNELKNEININEFMKIIYNTITNFYPLSDRYKLKLIDFTITEDEFISDKIDFNIKLDYGKNFNENKYILIDIYKNLRENSKISIKNIEIICYFFNLLKKIKFVITDIDDNMIINDISIDNLSEAISIINEKNDKKFDLSLLISIDHKIFKFNTVKNEFIKLYEIYTLTCKTGFMKNIIQQIHTLGLFTHLYLYKYYYFNILNISDIININESNILQNVNTNKDLFIKKIIDDFLNSDKTNQVIQITLQYIDKKVSDDEDVYDAPSYHANLMILTKFNHDGKICILGRRIEPHRHSNTYCRNSIRKEIRDIFDRLPNFYYVDYYMKNHMGLQVNECLSINKNYITEYFDEIKPKIKCELSQLYNIDGFCTTWCAYIASILLLNKQIPVINLSKYFTTLNLSSDKSFIDEIIEEYDKIDKQDVKSLELFKKNFNKIFKENIFKYSKTGFRYTYIKNLKLYTFIIYFYKLISDRYPILQFILSDKDNDYLKNVYRLYEDKNFMSYVEQKINDSLKIFNASGILITEKSNILEKNLLHLCEDKLFNHDELCLEEEICKEVPAELKSICGEVDKKCMKPINNTIRLDKEENDNLKKFKKFYSEHI
jgi:hypothetical protein